jgi:hypothetical protein
MDSANCNVGLSGAVSEQLPGGRESSDVQVLQVQVNVQQFPKSHGQNERLGTSASSPTTYHVPIEYNNFLVHVQVEPPPHSNFHLESPETGNSR